MSKRQVVLDAIEETFGVRLEEHHLKAMALTTVPTKRYRWQTRACLDGLFATDSLPWAEILRQAYLQAKSRRRSRAERRNSACHKTTGQHYPGMPNGWERRCCRKKGHPGDCNPGVTHYPQRPYEHRNPE